MKRLQHRRIPAGRPQWKGTEEASPMTDRELAHFDTLMAKYQSGELNILDCLEEPPTTVRAIIR